MLLCPNLSLGPTTRSTFVLSSDVISVLARGLLRRPAGVFYGWWIVLASMIADALKHGTFNRGFSVYVLPLRTELGIGIAAISVADMLGRLEGGLLGPLSGYMTDRFGPRIMMAFGGLSSGLGFILLAFTHNYLSFVLVFVGLISVGMRSGYNNASVPALNQWFRRRRAFAMSLASVGNGLGGFLIVPILVPLIVWVGWRDAAIISGIGIIVVVVPLSLLVRRSPETMGLQPDGDSLDVQQATPSTIRTVSSGASPRGVVSTGRDRRGRPERIDADFTVREAMRSASYWLLVWAVGLRNMVHSGMSFLMAPVMVWFLQGGGRTEEASLLIAGLFISALSLGSMCFNPLVGWLGDTWSKLKLSSVAMAAGAASLILLLGQEGHLWQLGLFVTLLSFAESANPLAWAIMGDFFGRRNYATLRGWQHLPDQLMSMSTPVWMGLIFDRTDSYFWALVPLAAIYGLAAVCYWTIPRPRPPTRLRPQ